MPADSSAPPITLADYPFQSFDKLRYGDTDRQGHVNNAVFATLMETGRVEILFQPEAPQPEADSAFVIARLLIDFRAELRWPGEVRIGSRVTAVGRSSVTLEQAVFQDGRLAASAQSVLVLMDETTRRSRPLPEALRQYLLQARTPAA